MLDLKFTKKTRPKTDFISFYGCPKYMMPKFVASGFNFGNYRDLGIARNEKYDSDERDRWLLFNNYFTLPGNPIIGNPKGNDEQTIVVNLEHKDLAEMKALVASLNKDTVLNDTHALDVPQEMYDAIRNIPGMTHTLKPSLVKQLRVNVYSNRKAREALVESFFQGNKTEAKEYIELIKDHHKTKDVNGVLGFYPGDFTGMRFVCVGSVGYIALAGSYYGLDSITSRLFGVGARGATAPTTQDNRQILSLDELIVLSAYRSNEPLIKTSKGVYVFSDKVKSKDKHS